MTSGHVGICCPQVADAGGGGDLEAFQRCLDLGPHWRWEPARCGCLPGANQIGPESPVLLDLDGDGFALTSASGGVRFDLNGDGVREQLSWTAAGVDDAWLALDRDADGQVTSGRELFGNYTPQPTSGKPNGFLALAEFDRPLQGGNLDGVIDVRDEVYGRLRLWCDTNHDGVSQAAELWRLPELGVTRLHLRYQESRREDEHGNWFRYRAKVERAKNERVNRWAWDVFLVRAP